MKKILIASLLIVCAVGASLAVIYAKGVRDHEPDEASLATSRQVTALMAPEERIELGRYLATVANCAGCHTVAGQPAFAGGLPLATSFGTFFGPNITPSKDHGIGSWSDDDFWQAMHNGKAPDGSLLYPAFPYTEYTKVSRHDSDALYAYLMSLPADETPNRPHSLQFPYDQRALLGFWRARYFQPSVSVTSSADTKENLETSEWLRGQYLVEGLGHCASCHTPRDRWGGTVSSLAWEGGPVASTGWSSTPLSNDPTIGLGRWSEQDIIDLLKTGVSQHGTASGPMGDVVRESTQYLSDADLQAMAKYLKSLPSGSPPPRVDTPSAAVMEIGQTRYTQYCAQCHGAEGEGNTTAWPALRSNISVTALDPSNVIRMILDGGFAPATQGQPQPHGMPPFSQTLNDNDVAAVATYIRNSWGNQAGEVRPFDVKQRR